MLAFPLLSACGTDDPDPVQATDSAPPPVDADGYTAEQREAIDLVEGFLGAVYGRGTKPIAQTSRGLVTDEYGAELIKTSKAQVEDQGKKWLGPYAFDPAKVTIEGDAAWVDGCLDLTSMFLVPRSDGAAGADSTSIGKVLPAKYRLAKVGDTWLVDGYEEAETTC
ncbi:hypothetical protein [Aeromicrobium duanguangcaii]|uniref:hypothetical protein n=1 Tax=Aeromicrobium duanguangcaii TaxID=2968086 RepID=UPI002017C6A5|nr:hypothetical protein [Aeromicrobium duanguangcaii]MCL3838430.1 hypothetical protein [Aeromicrobium duanguangcaii]